MRKKITLPAKADSLGSITTGLGIAAEILGILNAFLVFFNGLLTLLGINTGSGNTTT